ncbi:MAG: hypothetical protein KC925_01450 [Candidatus Doudnabacteria bacterium]|nr:hypothetical protein [Candidatus Doudnabacteria bacterium]
MTYSKAQMRKRYIKGIFVGLVIGALVMLVGSQLTVLGTSVFESVFGDTSEQTAQDRAEELREQAARGGGEPESEDVEASQEPEEEEVTDVEEAESSEDSADVSEEEEVTEESEETPSSTARVYENTTAGFEIDLPQGWDVTTGATEDVLSPTDDTDVHGHTHVTSGLLVRTRTKDAETLLQDVYDGSSAPAYYIDATGGATDTTVDGYPAVTFSGVIGYESTTITAIDLGTMVVEIHDPGEKHQDNGHYTEVLNAFSVR